MDTNQAVDILQQDPSDLELTSGQFSIQKLKQCLKPEKIQKLILHTNEDKKIIQKLQLTTRSQPRFVFTNLIILNLGYNKLESIQILQRLNLPQLRQLHLFENELNTIVSLRRCKQYYKIAGNKIIQLKRFSQANFAKLQQIWAYDNQFADGREELKIQGRLQAGSLGYPDFNRRLQFSLYFRCEKYQPLEIVL